MAVDCEELRTWEWAVRVAVGVGNRERGLGIWVSCESGSLGGEWE